MLTNGFGNPLMSKYYFGSRDKACLVSTRVIPYFISCNLAPDLIPYFAEKLP